MTGYEPTAPLVGATTDNGITTADTAYKTRDGEGRMPSFLALARATGGLYAEQLTGMSVREALAAADLDFTVAKADDLTVDVDGVRVGGLPKLRGTVAKYDDDRPARLLGVVGHNYPVVQPWEAAEFGQAVLEEGGATIAAIGAYGDPRGSRMFLALRLPDGLRVGGEDAHDLYLALGNSWDRGTGLWAVAAPIRLDCTNQFAATFGSLSGRFSIPHRGDMAYKVTEVQRALNLTGLFSEAYAKTAETLLDTPMVGAEIDQFLAELLPTPSGVKTDRGELAWAIRRNAAAAVIRDGENNTVGRGTRYAALQGAIEYVDWMSPAKNPVNRFSRLVDGGRHEEIKARAADLLLAGV